jgi:AcrR family transcriptional regulator
LSTPRGEARRVAILEAALRLVVRGGPRAVTHRAVADEASVPLAATTYYFASRDDLIAQALVLGAERDIARLGERGIEGTLDDLSVEAIAGFELWLEAARNPALRPAARQVSQAYVAGARELADDEVGARLIAAAVEGLALEVLAGGIEPAEARAALARLRQALTAGRRRR